VDIQSGERALANGVLGILIKYSSARPCFQPPSTINHQRQPKGAKEFSSVRVVIDPANHTITLDSTMVVLARPRTICLMAAKKKKFFARTIAKSTRAMQLSKPVRGSRAGRLRVLICNGVCCPHLVCIATIQSWDRS
jgi:hypothetical protein